MLTGFIPYPSSCIFIGDETKGDYSYLLPVKNDEGQMAIARVTNGEFSLLQTDVPIPKTCQWGEINYYLNFLVDRKCQRAYLLGMDAQAAVAPSGKARIYVVAIDYATAPAHLTLYYTDVLSDASNANPPLLTPDGDIMLMGGAPEGSYFKPTAATWLLHVSPYSHKAGARWPLWAWLLVALMLVSTIGVTKVWDKAIAPSELPGSVTVRLTRDGTDTGKTLTLSAAGGWKGAFTGIEPEGSYGVVEEAVRGFDATVSGNATEGTLVQNIKYTFSGSAVTRTCVDWEVGDNGKWKRGNKAESRLNHPTTSPLDSFKFDIDGNADYPERVAIQASIRNTSHASAVSGQCAGPDRRFGTRDDIYVGEKRQ
jgi:hypothetical protein